MAWWNTKEEELPEALRNMSAEEMLAAVEAGKSAPGQISDLEKKVTDGATANEALSADVVTLKTKLDAIEANPPRGVVGDPPPNPAGPEPTSFLQDEDRAFEERFDKRIDPVLRTTLSIGAQTAKTQAQTKFPREFKRWGTEIDEAVSKAHPQQLIVPEFWDNVVNMIKGLHMDEITTEVRKGEGDFFVEGSGGPPPPGDKKEGPEHELSDEEKKIADKMGVSHENYLKQRKEMTYVAG